MAFKYARSNLLLFPLFVPGMKAEEEEEVGIICESEESPRQIVPSKSRIAAEYSSLSRSVNSKCETGEPRENVRENNESSGKKENGGKKMMSEPRRPNVLLPFLRIYKSPKLSKWL